MSKSVKSQVPNMTRMKSKKTSSSVVEEVDSGLQQSTDRGLSEDSSGGQLLISPDTSIGKLLDLTTGLETEFSETDVLDQLPVPPSEDSFFEIPTDTSSSISPVSSDGTVGESNSEQSKGVDTPITTSSPDQEHGTDQTASPVDSVEDGHNTAEGQRLTFVKSIRVDGRPNISPLASSTPYRSTFNPFISRKKIIHFVRPVPEISGVRINRAYELRFTENLERTYLKQARAMSYRQYIQTAKILQKLPKLELGAGYP